MNVKPVYFLPLQLTAEVSLSILSAVSEYVQMTQEKFELNHGPLNMSK
jgi:hypothetical protein